MKLVCRRGVIINQANFNFKAYNFYERKGLENGDLAFNFDIRQNWAEKREGHSSGEVGFDINATVLFENKTNFNTQKPVFLCFLISKNYLPSILEGL